MPLVAQLSRAAPGAARDTMDVGTGDWAMVANPSDATDLFRPSLSITDIPIVDRMLRLDRASSVYPPV